MIESNTIENHSKTEVKDDNNKEQCTDLLMEPVVAENIDKPIESSLTIATRFLGVFYALVSTFIFTISMFVAKELKVDLLDAIIPSYLLNSILLFIYMKFIKYYSLYRKSTKQEIFFLFINVFCTTTGIFAYYLAYRYLTLPDVITIRFTQVIWTAIITTVLYREKPSIPMIVAILLTTIGVIFVAQPTFLFSKISTTSKTNISNNSQPHIIGILIAFYCSIAFAIGVLSNKHLFLRYKTKHSLIVFYFTFITLCALIAYVFYKYNYSIGQTQSFKNDFFNWRYLCASSVFLLYTPGLLLMQKAIKYEHPSIFTILQSSGILFSIILQNTFSSVKSNLLSLFGSALVLLSILIITGSKYINEQREKKKSAQQNSTK
ncbi:unnamed protein product [Rotaria sordida]|uniref:EamA domain-containing protein n=1 Tax=Rotaria sordida TaxID=392033 RepID=A0A815G655_9BILA|nr:unnamed protein product [Rotaria sordida]CAF3925468.1 unnamed protein product [Rotaria sordida]